MLRYFIVHLRRVQRPLQIAQATLARMADVYRLKEIKDDADDPKLPSKLVSVENVWQTIENLDAYFLLKHGSRGALLAYITRDEVDLPNADDGFGLPTYDQEIIQRCPHTGTEYQADNTLVWNAIRHVLHETPGWTWVQSFQRSQHGWNAYVAMKAHYLGSSFTARIKANADHTLSTSYYDGKSRLFTFERYCEVLKGAFSDLETTNEPVPEERKVRIMLQGLVDSRLATVKVNILANEATLGADFETAVDFVAQFLDDQKALNAGNCGPQQQRTISAMNSGGRNANGRGGGRSGAGRGGRSGRSGRGGRGGRGQSRARAQGFSGQVTDQYYQPEVWNTMTTAQQAKARQLRALRHPFLRRLRADRDSRRGIQVMESRRTRQKTDDDSSVPNTVTTSPASASASQVHSAGIGATLSQRTSRHNL